MHYLLSVDAATTSSCVQYIPGITLDLIDKLIT